MNTYRVAAIALLVGALALGGAGCRPLPVRSAATVRAQDLPEDPDRLMAMGDELIATGDRISLENALVVLEKWHRLDPESVEPVWRQALAAFRLADAAESQRNRRAYFAELGVKYARNAIALAPERVEGHYYLAVSLGYVAAARSFIRRIGALDLVPQIEAEGKKALTLDARYDHAGPHRLLGVLYMRAPRWPTSVGDVDEALEQMMKAVELAPDYPENHLYLGEALLANGRLDEADRELDWVLAVDEATRAPWADRLPRWRTEAMALKKKVHDRR